MTIQHEENLNERVASLAGQLVNGFDFVLVTPGATDAVLEVHFHNEEWLTDVTAAFPTDPTIFTISGGHRVRAGAATGQVQVTAVNAGPAPNVLHLTAAPIGDYSTYTLHVDFPAPITNEPRFDPIVSELPFRFRPGCFTIDCAPGWEPAPPPSADPSLDYLAKDYDSFKHALITAMMQRVPGWQPTSEADLDQTLLELFSAAGDELSDYQDRVMNEAYLGTARKRISLARHTRLMDYHIHQGNQASTWIALDITGNGVLPVGVEVWTGSDLLSGASQTFVTRDEVAVHDLLSRIGLYTWSGAIPALAAGSTSADLRIPSGLFADAEEVQERIRDGRTTHLVIQEMRDPSTGREAGRDPTKRQLLELVGGQAMFDPVEGEWLVRVRWQERDQLSHNYCFTVDCPGGDVHDVSLCFGNLVRAYHGQARAISFHEPGTALATDQYHFERAEDERRGVICRLPDEPLAYDNTPPGGDVPPNSTLQVEVEDDSGTVTSWEEAITLVHSDEQAEHFVVETDELGRSALRFGNGINGRKLASGVTVRCRYQVGRGLDGNVGADMLVNFDATFHVLLGGATLWNPFDVADGRAPELRDTIIRRAPEAYRARQLRAVTLKDYEGRAEQLELVSEASARYAWTGSWRTVRVAIDPAGTATLEADLRDEVTAHVEAVRLIGEDLEIRAPRFVPLEIVMVICLRPDTWPSDVQFVLEQEFSEGYTPDGRPGFFHPDLWTFGQPLYASQLLGRAQGVTGVEHVVSVSIKRWDDAALATEEVLEVRSNEIIRVRNDPDHMEEGSITFDLSGGSR